MAILLFETPDIASALAIANSAKAGSLWGVDTTGSKASSQNDRALVECTNAIAELLMENIVPPAVTAVFDSQPSSFEASTENSQVWFLRGLL